MKNITKSLLISSFLLFVVACGNEKSELSSSSANLAAAEINKENLLLITQSLKDETKLREFKKQSSSCSDRDCRRKVKYNFFENTLADIGFSHIKTFKNFIVLFKSVPQNEPLQLNQSEDSQLLGAWGQIFMPTLECISKDKCKAWLIAVSYTHLTLPTTPYV